jgi:hypothetical protein
MLGPDLPESGRNQSHSLLFKGWPASTLLGFKNEGNNSLSGGVHR